MTPKIVSLIFIFLYATLFMSVGFTNEKSIQTNLFSSMETVQPSVISRPDSSGREIYLPHPAWRDHDSTLTDSSPDESRIGMTLFTAAAELLPSMKRCEREFLDLEMKKNLVVKQVLLDCLRDTSLSDIITTMPIGINEIQHDYLHEREALLNFEVTEQYINAFVITKDTVEIVNLNINRKFMSQQLISLLKPLYDVSDPLHLSFNLKLAHEIYEQIFAPLVPYLDNISSLIIIPDDIFWGFPFECLVVTINSTKEKKISHILYDEYRHVTFLINKYAISYNFSTLALNNDFPSSPAPKKLGRQLLTMSEIIASEDTSAIAWNLHSPIHGKEEVQRVSRLLWYHTNLKREEATKKYLIDHGFKFRWIYLAIPGMLNSDTLKSSALIFTESRDPLQNNKLTIEEIIRCKFRADLLTLSACESKPVEAERKIGVIGIPQSFLCAGVKSVIFSLWRINDITVSRFMSKFYWELKYKRQTNSFALQQAKISSINDTFEYDGKQIARAHPHFWAAFILIGDANLRPPTFSTIPPKMVILIVYVLVFTISLIIVRKTVNLHKFS